MAEVILSPADTPSFDGVFIYKIILSSSIYAVTIDKFQKLKLPDVPGIYFFKKGKTVLYVGKATSLRDRVRSYFSKDLIDTRGPLIVKMVEEASTIDWEETQSVLEALILEAHTIKTLTPSYNSKEKDNKSYNYVVITDEAFPKVLIIRGREILLGKDKKGNLHDPYLHIFGPFPHGTQLREALKIVRKLFPYRDKCIPLSELKDFSKAKPCFNRQIGMCPGVCTGEVDQKEYTKIIKNIVLFFEGKKKTIEKNLLKDMKDLAKKKQFEKAQEIKEKIYSLNHIRDVTLIKRDVFMDRGNSSSDFRVEAYDVAHFSGKETVGVMTVVENGEVNKDQYRKFKIRGIGGIKIDDTGNLKELLKRRIGHLEWQLPDLIVIDGGTAQINVARNVLKENNLNIEIVSVVKDDRHKPKDFIGEKKTIEKYKNEILLANSESHRFAINFHRTRLRGRIKRKF